MWLYREVLYSIKTTYFIMKDKRINIISNKIESNIFSWEYKVISIIIFSFLVSMLPTIAMYYFSYLLIAFCIYIVKVIFLH